MKPLSDDLRRRILDAVDRGEGSRREIARRFAVDVSCVTRLIRLRRETGSIRPRPHGGGRAPTLSPDDLERLRRLAEDDPRASCRELKERLGIEGSTMVVWRALRSLGVSRGPNNEK